jgi:hypothetical protein
VLDTRREKAREKINKIETLPNVGQRKLKNKNASNLKHKQAQLKLGFIAAVQEYFPTPKYSR